MWCIMYKKDFNFELPNELIARYPLAKRSTSRLLVHNRKTKEHNHHIFKDLIDFLVPGDVLVMNDSRVIAARFYGQKATGGKVEFLVERILDDANFLAHIKSSKSPKVGSVIDCDNAWQLEIVGRQDDLFCCKLSGNVLAMLADIGHMPLPPYIDREDNATDKDRYQTVYAKNDGSVAAPTAGLHFDEDLIQKLTEKGIILAYTTLHVGAGTFRPVRCENIKEHKMHSEFITVSAELCQQVNAAKERGSRVVAVGTTAMRCLESTSIAGKIKPFSGETDIFIYPGYEFKICDGMVTNFHLPESTLLMLVAAFIGHEEALNLYKVAVDAKYRFFSYGDACLLL